MLRTEELTKRYGRQTALDRFTCDFSAGIYGLLGPNGAGKTTLINLLVGLSDQDSGSVSWNGEPIRELDTAYFSLIGYLPQSPVFYRNFSAEEFIEYLCEIKGIPRKDQKAEIDRCLSLVNLTDERKKKIGAFSGGMRQRLGIAQALIGNPKILIMDEPTAGLDPKERIRFRNVISQISAGRIILIATHIVLDIESIAHHLIFMNRGEIVKQGSPDAVMEQLRGKVWKLDADRFAVSDYLNQYPMSNIFRQNDVYSIRILSETKPQSDAVPTAPTLEDAYLYFCKNLAE